MALVIAPAIPTSFRYFSYLPCELREAVWHEAVSQLDPRIVHFHRCGEVYALSSSSPPALFAVCKQSHAVASKYSLQLLWPYNSTDPVFFNPEVDTLLFRGGVLPWDALLPFGSGPRIQDVFSLRDLNRMKNLCFIYASPHSGQDTVLRSFHLDNLVLNLDIFKSVETVTFGTSHNSETVKYFLLSRAPTEVAKESIANKVDCILSDFNGSLLSRYEKAFPGLKLPTIRFLSLDIIWDGGIVDARWPNSRQIYLAVNMIIRSDDWKVLVNSIAF